jgi:hypothetical protein
MAKRTRNHMTEDHRLAGFKALVESGKNGGYLMEDVDGSFRSWQEMSVEGKVDHIARDAAYYCVPFEAFAEAVRGALLDLSADAREEAALRVVLHSAMELLGLAKLIPDDGKTESVPLIEQFQELLGKKSLADLKAGGKERKPGRPKPRGKGIER